MRALISCAAAIVALALTAPSPAQPGERWSDTCNDTRGRRHPADVRIAGCTTLIESDLLSSANLAYAHLNRGRAYAELGNRRRAIADFRRALRLAPSDPQARAALCEALARTDAAPDPACGAAATP